MNMNTDEDKQKVSKNVKSDKYAEINKKENKKNKEENKEKNNLSEDIYSSSVRDIIDIENKNKSYNEDNNTTNTTNNTPLNIGNDQIEDKEMEDKEEAKKQTIFLFGTILAIIIIIVALFAIPKLFIDDKHELTTMQRNKLVEELHQKNKAGNLPDDGGILYNDFSFVLYKPFNIWNFQVYSSAYNALFNIYVHFTPLQLNEITVTGIENLDKFYENTLNENNGIVERINGNSSLSSFSFAGEFVGQSYLVYDPGVFVNQGLFTVVGEITTALGQSIGVGLVPGCTSSEYGCGDYGNIISCDTTEDPVIYLKYSEESSINITEDCITISGNNIDIENKNLMKAVDKFIFLSLRIMDK